MAKVKMPQDYGVTVPKKAVIDSNDDEMDEDEEDEAYEAMSDEGLAPAAEDLTVKDLFAGLIAAATPRSPGQRDDDLIIAQDSYAIAGAMCRERARLRAKWEEEDGH